MKIKHILVFQPWIHHLSHEILYGVLDYFSETGSHRVEVMPIMWEERSGLSGAQQWECHGLIAPLISDALYRRVAALKWRCINTHSGMTRKGVPCVDIDHYATGCMAAEHLLGQGYESFAYIGLGGMRALELRGQGFLDTIRAETKTVSAYSLPDVLDIPERNRKQWTTRLQKLPKPCGVYCSDDQTARSVTSFARSIGIHVPDELAMVGTQNDEGLCRGMSPPLSSVHLPYRKVGYESGRLLDEWIKTRKRPASPPPLPPSHIEVRASSQALAVEDENLRRAIRYLRAHYMDKVSMPDVARQSGLSLRNLQRRFQQHLGHTPQTELRRIRMQRAKELLRDTGVKLEDIADQTGFPNANYLCEQFRRLTGVSPGTYRSQNRRLG